MFVVCHGAVDMSRVAAEKRAAAVGADVYGPIETCGYASAGEGCMQRNAPRPTPPTPLGGLLGGQRIY